MDKIIVPAPAKINLSLDIIGFRSDSYHDLEMIMQSIELHDDIIIEKNNKKRIVISTSVKNLPEGRKNLAYQAASKILEKSGIKEGVSIHINKKIPISAGLAGGSTDAAATLKGINLLFDLNYSYKELEVLAGQIGSDLPFCLRGGTVYATGKGNILKQLPDLGPIELLIIKLPIEISTTDVYKRYDILQEDINVPTNNLLNIIMSGKEIKWDEGWRNVLEGVTSELVPEIKKINKFFADNNIFSMMSGSGPSVFAIIDSQNKKDLIKNKQSIFPGDKIFTRMVKKDFMELW